MFENYNLNEAERLIATFEAVSHDGTIRVRADTFRRTVLVEVDGDSFVLKRHPGNLRTVGSMLLSAAEWAARNDEQRSE